MLLRAVAALSLAAALGLAGPAATREPVPRYPDLRSLPPSDVLLDSRTVGQTTRYALRFSTTIWNAGQGPLELRGEAADGRTLAYQRVHDDAGGFTERPVGEFVFHPGHDHWHFEHFAEYELWPEPKYRQWLASGRQQGQARWRGSKTTGLHESFCVRDSEPVEELPGRPDAKVYDACDQELQGLSVGWGDSYPFFLAGQWILFGESRPDDGCYVLRVIADPSNVLYESEDRADPDRESAEANDAVAVVRIQGTTAEVVEGPVASCPRA